MSNATAAVDQEARDQALGALNHVVSLGTGLSQTNQEVIELRRQVAELRQVAEQAIAAAQEARVVAAGVRDASDQRIQDVIWGKFKDFLAAQGGDWWADQLARRLDHNRPDYDRSVRDWMRAKLEAWGVVSETDSR